MDRKPDAATRDMLRTGRSERRKALFSLFMLGAMALFSLHLLIGGLWTGSLALPPRGADRIVAFADNPFRFALVALAYALATALMGAGAALIARQLSNRIQSASNHSSNSTPLI